eukprot:CAMPEP_0194693794 /NCGR_PEP_ID=MMETSP0295-20121207/20793_1 /TAXON_ID=39354 /ORGANISM="Heterosigma akashiwo, Strain CCMP2393" /LENGTH=163 /DNA_ID=CAMNT_0039584843 /DNA_START=496 /DNA_END=987 /DNA_ORIENTATION=-
MNGALVVLRPLPLLGRLVPKPRGRPPLDAAPLQHGEVASAHRDQVGVPPEPSHVHHMPAVGVVAAVGRVPDHAGVVEELDPRAVVAGGQEPPAAAHMGAVDVSSVGAVGPDAHDGEPEDGRGLGPLAVCLDRVVTVAYLLCFVCIPIQDFISPTVAHNCTGVQ